jgi:hypothetical protein
MPAALPALFLVSADLSHQGLVHLAAACPLDGGGAALTVGGFRALGGRELLLQRHRLALRQVVAWRVGHGTRDGDLHAIEPRGHASSSSCLGAVPCGWSLPYTGGHACRSCAGYGIYDAAG